MVNPENRMIESTRIKCKQNIKKAYLNTNFSHRLRLRFCEVAY